MDWDHSSSGTVWLEYLHCNFKVSRPSQNCSGPSWVILGHSVSR